MGTNSTRREAFEKSALGEAESVAQMFSRSGSSVEGTWATKFWVSLEGEVQDHLWVPS